MVYLTTWTIHGFSHWFLKARENTAKSTLLWAFWLFFHNIVSTCFKIYRFHKRKNWKKHKGNLFFLEKKKQFQTCWNSKQIITKENEGMDVISSKIRNINIRQKHATHACTNLSLFLITTSKNYISLPKTFMKSAATGIWRENVPGF